MPLKLKSNTFQRKLNKPSSNTNQLKESSKEFNIFQSKLKSSTTQKETTTLPDKVNTSEPVMLIKDTLLPALINKEPPTFQPKAVLELKPSIKQVTFQSHHQSSKDNLLLDKESPLKDKPNTLLDPLIPPLTALDQFILPDKLTPLDKPTLLEAVESEEKTSTDNHKLEAMSLEEVESDNDLIDLFISFYT